MRTCFLRTALVAGCLLGAAPLAAQTVITGSVLSGDSGDPIEGVQLLLVDSLGSTRNEAVTDSDGWFRLVVPEAGNWSLVGTMIGYQDLRSDPFAVELLETVVVEVRMAIEAVPLEPLVVTSRISHLNADLKAFYDRMARGRRSGFGRFVSREDVDRQTPLEPTDLLRTMAGVHVVRGPPGNGRGLRMSGNCIPAIYIDGSHLNRFNENDSLDDYLSAMSIEGIEVYRGSTAQVGRFHDPSGCGLILVWTRRGSPDGGRFSWKKIAIGTALVIGVVLLGT